MPQPYANVLNMKIRSALFWLTTILAGLIALWVAWDYRRSYLATRIFLSTCILAGSCGRALCTANGQDPSMLKT